MRVRIAALVASRSVAGILPRTSSTVTKAQPEILDAPNVCSAISGFGVVLGSVDAPQLSLVKIIYPLAKLLFDLGPNCDPQQIATSLGQCPRVLSVHGNRRLPPPYS